MAVTYHAGRRIQGTQADFDGTPAVSGGWKELGRTTLSSASSTITVSSLPNKRYYKVLTSITGQASNSDVSMRLNGDTTSNYVRRFSTNGGSDISGTVTALPYHYTDVAKTTPIFAMAYLANKSDKEKLSISHGVRETGTTTGAPSRFESVGKWTNASDAIDEIQVLGSSNFNSGSECVVLGWDPDDTHTDNFWEELASVDLSGGSSDNFSSGTFTNKKYLWVQAYITATGGTKRVYGRFNGVSSGNNYGLRASANGSESTDTSQNQVNLDTGNTDANPVFVNMFIVNDGTNEPLAISHAINRGSSGETNAPERCETVFKSANTTAITSVSFHNIVGTGSFGTESFMKVWGSN